MYMAWSAPRNKQSKFNKKRNQYRKGFRNKIFITAYLWAFVYIV